MSYNPSGVRNDEKISRQLVGERKNARKSPAGLWASVKTLGTIAKQSMRSIRHCEEQSDETIEKDYFIPPGFAMTEKRSA